MAIGNPILRTWKNDKGKDSKAWVVYYDDPLTGERRSKQWKFEKFGGQRAAKDEARDWRPKGLEDEGTATVKREGERYIEWMRSVGRHPADKETPFAKVTIDDHEARLQNHVYPKIGHVPVSELNNAAAQRFLDSLGVGKDLRNRIKATLSLVLDESVRTGRMDANPMRVLENRPSPRRARIAREGEEERGQKIRRVRRIPSAHECAKMIQAAKKSYDAALLAFDNGKASGDSFWRLFPMLVIATFCGLRWGEIRALRVGDVAFSDPKNPSAGGEINIRQGADRYGKIGEVKTTAGYRETPMPPEVAAVVKQWIESPLRPGREKTDRLFATGSGGVLYLPSVQARWISPLQRSMNIVEGTTHRTFRRVIDGNLTKIREAIPKAKYSPNEWRHFAVSLWRRQGIDWSQIAKWVGHENGSFTEARYGHILAEDQVEAVAIANQADAVGWTMSHVGAAKLQQ